MLTSDLNVVMLLFQPSVVARGIEKKLLEMNNKVESIIGDFSKIDTCMDDTDLFILNLPNKIADDTKEIQVLVSICDTINSKKKRMIVVGERELWEELGKIYTGVCKFVWVYRPVGMDELFDAIIKVMTASPKRELKPRILIVDDDPSYAKIVREWIKEYARVDIVTAGMQAITFLLKVPEEDKVDLILLDYEMPVVDGPQVFQMLKQDPQTAKIPVIFLTGVGTREGVSRVMSLKPDGYILKTTSKENLLGVIDNKLGIL